MIIIGEKINSTIKSIMSAIESQDTAFIKKLAKDQHEAGAQYIDVNAGMFLDEEPEKLAWLIETIQSDCSAPFSIDSPNSKALLAGLKANKNGKPIINSITDEKNRYDSVLPLAVEYNARVIALCMDDKGMPETVKDRVIIAARLIDKLTKSGINIGDIFIDPMVRPIGTGSQFGNVAIETIRTIKTEYPEAHIACGLSNISFGIPARKVMNQAFLIAAMSAGMDGAILDPLDKRLMTFLYAGEALFGHDEYCMDFLTKYREGELEL